jgi:hypothetical protein
MDGRKGEEEEKKEIAGTTEDGWMKVRISSESFMFNCVGTTFPRISLNLNKETNSSSQPLTFVFVPTLPICHISFVIFFIFIQQKQQKREPTNPVQAQTRF